MSALFVDEYAHDMHGILMPHAEIHLVARFGASARDSLDLHAIGGRQNVHRKSIRGGVRTVAARLRLGTSERVFGVPASALAGRIVALEELWGTSAAQRLFEQLLNPHDLGEAAGILERAINERILTAETRHAHARIAIDAADKLSSASVGVVAMNLGISERHLRRVFRDTIGISPKAFAKLVRFKRALRAVRENARVNWADIAATTGYYDQAHLIAEFRTIAGVTPSALLEELQESTSWHE